jgi:uncharacterized cupredoxin-like copper-binding protein
MRATSARLRVSIGLSIVALASAACGGTTPTVAPPAAGPTTVKVTLQEWAVVPAPASVAAGAVKFEVTNSGPADIHEFVVIKTDLAPGALPVDSTGTVTEGGTEMTVVDEIEDIPVGQTQELRVTLTPGKYVLLCNIYSAEEQEAHYTMGMRVAFEVTG